MSASSILDGLCNFIASSPTPFHAVSNMVSRLEDAGFTHCADGENWVIEPGGRYYFTRNDSSLIALNLGSLPLTKTGFRMVGAHTDSPCLKIKPVAEIFRQGYMQLGVEVYGGALLNPWFDRDLSIAGRIGYLDKQGKLNSALIDFAKPVAFIPSLAIHLDREVNQKRTINQQTDLPPVMLQTDEGSSKDFKSLLRTQALLQHQDLDIDTILDYELCLYDVAAPAIVGLEQDFLAAARLDNLLSCHAGLEALLASATQGRNANSTLLVCTDHEEVGSASASGAGGPFLESVLLRISEILHAGSQQDYQRMLSQTLLISADNAHAIHPNFQDRHDSKHGPRMNAGIVIKYNANQRYATNSNTAAYFRKLCTDADVPFQSFVVRSDMGCGSTIGPIVSAELGVQTIDIGVPTLGMHSIRELAGSRDTDYLCAVLTGFYTSTEEIAS